MHKLFNYMLYIIISFVSLKSSYCQINTIGTSSESSYLWETVSEYVRRYEKQIFSANKQLIQQKINKLKSINDTSLINGINFALSSINNDFINTLDMPDTLEIINSYNTSVNDYFKKYYLNFLNEIENNTEINIIIGNYKDRHNERKLQFFQNINNTKFQSQQNIFSNFNQNPETSANSYPNPINYVNNGNGFIYSQQNQVAKQPALSGLLSVTNPAFKMIVSTVLMCLGSTPYGAIAVLVVVTVYTLIEIVIKFFFNKIKNKNILDTIKRSSNLDIQRNASKSVHNSTSNLVFLTDKTPNRKLLRNFISKNNNEISKVFEDFVLDLIQNNSENANQEKKLDFFVQSLLEYISINQSLNTMKKGFLAENITKNISGRFMNSLLDFFVQNNKTTIENHKKSGNSAYLIDEDIKIDNYHNSSSYELPDWYKQICTIYLELKKNRILLSGENDDWVPINNALKPKNEYLFELNNEIDNILNFETETKNSSLVYTQSLNGTIGKDSTHDEFNKNENNILGTQSDLLGHHNNTENKWYDRMIKYSIQSYRQNGIRGVITMILDIFSTIFSATPIGYLLVTLIRLIAFMTDKLLLLSRRRKNQHQLVRLMLEIPEIFNEDKLSVTLKEINYIENECNDQEEVLIKLFKRLIRHLQNFNPTLNVTLANKEIKNFINIVKNKNNFILDYLNQNRENKHSTHFRSLLNQKKFFDSSYSEGWTLNDNDNQENIKPTLKERNNINNSEQNFEITSKVIKETKYNESKKESTNIAKNSFQNMIGGLKSFLLNLFKSIFGGAGELWEYIKGLLLRIIDFIKTLWDLIRGEKKKRVLIELLEEMPNESVVHSHLFVEIINILSENSNINMFTKKKF